MIKSISDAVGSLPEECLSQVLFFFFFFLKVDSLTGKLLSLFIKIFFAGSFDGCQ